MEFLTFKYFGLDWAAMLLTFAAIYYIGNKNRIGLVLMMLGNICWASIAIQENIIAMAIANIAFLVMNGRAVYKWSANESNEAV